MTDANVPQVVPVMLGTAGHVDHGKTSLVRRLTGVDTDRLKEEKERGMSIDLAVAPLTLPDGKRLGVIDVPGHEDFIRNMVAGASSIDVLMLITAADDAVMPQTVEHLKIARLLGMEKLIGVITKIDLVDETLLSLAVEEVEALFMQSGFSGSPIVCVSNETGAGFPELISSLSHLVGEVAPPPDERAFRMYARHSFTKKGYGTVVTGVPLSGSIRAGERLELLPVERSVVLRAVQTYGDEASESRARVSSALNVRDIEPAEIERGMCLAAPGVYRSTTSLLAVLRNDSDEALTRRMRVRFLCQTASSPAVLRLLDDSIQPGAEGYARLTFDRPLACASGDRFIVRTLSPAMTVGGGRVLTIDPGRVRRSDFRLLPRLRRARELIDRGDFFGAELYAGGAPVLGASSLSALTQRLPAEAEVMIEVQERSGMLSALGGAWLVTQRADELRESIRRSLARYHRANRHSWGMRPEYAAELLGVGAAGIAALKTVATAEGDIVLRHGFLSLKSFEPSLSPREMKLREGILELLSNSDSQAVAKGDLQESLQMSAPELKQLLKLLVDEQEVSTVSNMVFRRSAVEHVRSQVLELFAENPLLELPAVREKTGLSRNLAVLILELFDAEGMTKRQGSGRVLVVKKKGH